MILTKSKVNKCFAGQTHQRDVLIALYELVYGKQLWSRIKRVTGWPTAGEALHQYIGECFIRFDEAYHLDVFAGGLWMNNGWCSDQELLEPWEVVPAPYELAVEE